MAKVSIIASIGKYDNALGKNKDLVWRISADLKRFKTLTMGHPIIMGRKTFESIGRVLPGRTNIVITHNKDYDAKGAIVALSLEEALRKANEVESREIFVIGGGEIFNQALPLADKLYLTLIDDCAEDPDVFFPQYKEDFTRKTFEAEGEEGGIRYTWVDLERG
ncbi:MAG: Dihydrofolate reductase [Parcubacteria group bacterium GW2011_GWA1_47_11]|nr:MAG: Dihydrofolate reductase [Parcubacteria group bacterium GW2011_GWA1_47_11]